MENFFSKKRGAKSKVLYLNASAGYVVGEKFGGILHGVMANSLEVLPQLPMQAACVRTFTKTRNHVENTSRCFSSMLIVEDSFYMKTNIMVCKRSLSFASIIQFSLFLDIYIKFQGDNIMLKLLEEFSINIWKPGKGGKRVSMRNIHTIRYIFIDATMTIC